MNTNTEIDPKELKKLEDLVFQVIEIKKKLLIGRSSLTPVNYNEEKEKFFKSKTYNPVYKYKDLNLPNLAGELVGKKLEIEKIILPNDLKDYIQEFLDDQINLFNTKNSIGKKDFSNNAHKLFDWGTDRLDMILTNTPSVEFRMDIDHFMQNADKIKMRFEKVLKDYGISGFRVKIDKFSPHIISVGYKTIDIGYEIRRFECNVDRLIIHEIESHVLQTYNMLNCTTPLSELSKYGDKHLYGEGLAVFNEINTRKITPSAFETYYFRIKAVRNINKTFRQIYEILAESINPSKAFVMTYRVKRGLTDTSKPGGFPKDAAYLLGYHEIENLAAENYPEKLMYATKSPTLSTLLNKYRLINLEKVITPRF